MIHRTRRATAAVATGLALTLALAACAGDSDEPTEEPGGDSTDSGDTGDSEAPSDPSEITLVLPPEGWPEGVAVTYLWANFFEQEGYDVSLETAGDMGVIYTALAGGQYDLFFDAWLPITHADYFEEYGDSMEQIGAWYDDARLTIAVNEDAPITSLTELADNADAFGNRIVGIEPGAGLTRVTKEEVIPTYGLEGMEFVESSSPAMLAELSGAVEADRDIVVTLWRPHWAYDEFPIRDLEDPEGTLGGAEEIVITGRDGFSEEYPQATAWLENFTLSGDDLFSLENIMFNENEGENREASVEQWLEENPDIFDEIKAGAEG